MIIFETDEFKKVAQNALLFCKTFPQCVVAYRWGARDDDLIVVPLVVMPYVLSRNRYGTLFRIISER